LQGVLFLKVDNNPSNSGHAETKPRYRWPWFVLGALLLAIVLAIAWMSREIERTRQIRELNSPPQQKG